MQFFRRLLRRDAGQDTVEYALLAGLMAVVVIYGVVNYRHRLGRVYAWVEDAVAQAEAAEPGAGRKGGAKPGP